MVVSGEQACETSDESADLEAIGEQRFLSAGLPPKRGQGFGKQDKQVLVLLFCLEISYCLVG